MAPSYKVAKVARLSSQPAGKGFLRMHANHVKQCQRLGQFTGLPTLVLTDGGTLLKQLIQAIAEAGHHGRHGFIVWRHRFPLKWMGEKKPPQWAVRVEAVHSWCLPLLRWNGMRLAQRQHFRVALALVGKHQRAKAGRAQDEDQLKATAMVLNDFPQTLAIGGSG